MNSTGRKQSSLAMKKALVVGDINIDIILGGMQSPPQVDREIACQSYEVTMGSSAAIFACAYAALGGAVSFLGLAGQDEAGDFMIRGLESFGVDTSLVRRTDRVRTGVTVNLIYRNTRSQITYPGAIAEFDGAEIDEATLAAFDHVHLAGPYQQTRFRPRIRQLLELARNLGLSTSLDPQWDASEQWRNLDEWLPLLSYFFPNQDEALSITRTTSIEAACEILASLTNCPLIKAGGEGALLYYRGEVRRVAATPVEVVDSTGAGDSFDAGFLYAVLEKGMDLIRATEFANALAARSCTFVGGVNHRSTYEDAHAFQ